MSYSYKKNGVLCRYRLNVWIGLNTQVKMKERGAGMFDDTHDGAHL